VIYSAPGLGDEENRRAFAEALEAHTSPDYTAKQATPESWSDLVASLASAGPLTIIIEGHRYLTASNKRFWRSFGEGWQAIRASGQRIHLVFVDDEAGLGRTLNEPGSPLQDPVTHLRPGPHPAAVEVVSVRGGSLYEFKKAFPRWKGTELILGYSLFGGLPHNWTWLNENATPIHEARRLLVHPQALLLNRPWELLEQKTQTVPRYARILSAVANGAHTRRELRQALGADGAESFGPYLTRLQELGLLEAQRPMDSGRTGRRTRYRLTDTYEGFWWKALHPVRGRLLCHGQPSVWDEEIAPLIEGHLRAVLPDLLLQFLKEGAAPLLGANARIAGPLWGPGYDFPVAAVLENGAICYGTIHLGPDLASSSVLADLNIGETRFGFGREARLRLIFSTVGFDEELTREAARNPLVQLIGIDELVGFGSD